MKHYSNSPKDSFFNPDERAKKLPVTSQEAHHIVRSTTALNDISDIVYRFNLLVHKVT
ncbi:hypothetical protein Lgra_1525 [Legionella gratiana]|uniref:Uncharacterized protein n=1 Tax=Legionella gratiana TaxID=45066 RepID=A0A378JFT0_9GAMM|nr:hypothetical protein [Legionella gratiana]KTD12067.1 hypothetical protein Lgra_1525 [Legionella gratiana]STX46329.1 Uncharacterised protein [Legionella gratiana]